MTSQLQRRFSNNITTLYRRLFTMLLQRRDMVERCRDLKTTTLQRRHDVLCLPGWNRWTGGVSMKDYEKREKNKGNENKTILGDFNCTMDIMDRDGEKKTKRLYWCYSSYALSKLIVDNGLEDLSRRENPDSSELTRYDRSFGKDPG